MKNKIFAIIVGIILVAASLAADAVGDSIHSVIYYSGTAQILNLLSGVSSTQDVVMVRTVDSASNMLSEIACAKSAGSPAQISPVYMKIAGNTLKIADTEDVEHPNQLTGTGTVDGPAWNWNYLTFSMTWKNGVKVQDANFLVNNMIVGRKQLFLPNGQPLELYDINMTSIDQATYEKSYKSINCSSSGQ